ncbi:hypothetical protein EWB00_005377 [Schistosoma japonicum]|uniref:G-protein coupled receptors family 2 profile 2 domain-containing protein n=1 Tax=Schistosoma japonicum TaxID=6182 RepID=A0A4Z2D1N0_SCHJA|nr:hypothetical protein EWB00_005377 [Schistosoma japonicum]
MWKYLCIIIIYNQITYSITSLNRNELKDSIKSYKTLRNNTCNSLIANCHCDELCQMKFDCCSDYPLLNNSQHNVILTTKCIRKFHYVSDEMNILKEYQSINEQIYAIANCPLNTSKNLAERCNRVNHIEIMFHDDYDWRISSKQYITGIISNKIIFNIKTSDIRTIAPVVSLKTNRIYANIDCAQCHGELKSQPGENFNEYIRKYLKFYTVKIRCQLISNMHRLCQLDTALPPSYSRYCPSPLRFNGTPLLMYGQHIKWHEFLAIPKNYLGFDIHNDKEEKSTTVLQIIESLFDILQIIVSLFSAICLCALLIIHGKTKSLHQRLSNQLVMGLSTSILSLLIVYLTLPLVIGQINITNRRLCVMIAFLIHYFFLCSFTWMSTFGISLMHTFGGIHTCQLCISYIKLKVTNSSKMIDSINQKFISNAMQSMVIQSAKRSSSNSSKSIILSSLLAIMLPLCFVIPAIIINEKVYPNECIHEQYIAKLLNNDIDESVCTKTQWILSYLTPGFCPPENCTRPWFTINEAFFLWFLTPTTILLAFNCIVLIIVSTHIWFLSRNELNTLSHLENEIDNNEFPKQSRKMLKICFNLSIILGLVWIFQILASLLPNIPLIGRIASLVSSSQGAALAFTTTNNLKRKTITTCTWTSIFTLNHNSTNESNQQSCNWIKSKKGKMYSLEKLDSNLQSTKCDDC